MGATTRAGFTSPLRDRFGIVQRLEFYSVSELAEIVTRSANKLDLPIEKEGAAEISRRSRGTPRISNRLLRRVRDVAEVKGNGVVSAVLYERSICSMSTNRGLTPWIEVLLAIVDRFGGGPVGLDALAASISEERGTIEDVLEPYLIQQGYLMRTPRGRVATEKTYLHFGLPAPMRENEAGAARASTRRHQLCRNDTGNSD